MENFKFVVFSVIALIILTSLGYLGFSTIKSDGSSLDSIKLRDLTKENESLKNEISDLNKKVVNLQSQIEEQEQAKQQQEELAKKASTPTETTFKHQILIDDLTKIMNSGLQIKKGSRGTNVGTLQNFLNICNKTSNKIDNDFGSSMETAVKKFQKDQGLAVDGQVGPGTLRQMISWLKKQ